MLSILRKNHKFFEAPGTNAAKLQARKSQASMELLAFFSISLLIFSITYTVVFDKIQDAYDSKSRAEAVHIGEKVAENINAAVSEGSGYSRNITLPDNIFGAPYNISVDSNTVFVKWRGKNAAARTMARNITGNFSSGNNYLSNREGIIFVN